MSRIRVFSKKRFNKAAEALCDPLDLKGLSAEEIGWLAEDVEKLSDTNCWWLTYDLRSVFKKLISDEVKYHRKAKR